MFEKTRDAALRSGFPWMLVWIYVITPTLSCLAMWIILRSVLQLPSSEAAARGLLGILIQYSVSILPATWIRFIFKKSPIASRLTLYFATVGCMLLSWPIYYFLTWLLFGEGFHFAPAYLTVINIYLVLSYGQEQFADGKTQSPPMSLAARIGIVFITVLIIEFCYTVVDATSPLAGGRMVVFGFIFYYILTDKTEPSARRGYDAEPFAVKREDPVPSVPSSPPSSGKAIIPPWEQDQ